MPRRVAERDVQRVEVIIVRLDLAIILDDEYCFALAGKRHVAVLEQVRFDDGLEGGFGVAGRSHCSTLMRCLSAGG